MRLKLTKKAMWALTELVGGAVRSLKPNTTADLLVVESLQRLCYDLQKRCIIEKSQYTMVWHPERCLAFHAAFETYLPPPAAMAIAAKNQYHSAEQYAYNVVRSLMAQAHKEHIIYFLNHHNQSQHDNDSTTEAGPALAR